VHLCGNAQRTADETVATHCEAIGRTVAGTPPLLAGALEALRTLAHALPTVLYTQSGNVDYQLGCIAECGVLDVVQHERVRITDRKTTEQFRAVLAEFGVSDPRNVWMIGNSMRSDINPALEVGANAIFVDVDEPWEFDVVDPLHTDFHRVRTFPEAVDLLLNRVR
jgi:putative hydrolase of the HAD superfamily